LEPLRVARAHHQTEVRQAQQNQAVKKDNSVVVEVGPVKRATDRLRGAEANGPAEETPQHVRHHNVLEALLEEDAERAKSDTETEAGKRIVAERLQLIRGKAHRDDEQ